MVTVYGLKNCDTCRKAVKWLEGRGLAAELSDVRRTPLSREQLQRFVDHFGIEALVNRRGTTWRQLPENQKNDLSADTAADLLMEHPAIMKRPVFEAGDRLIIGFDAKAQEALAALS